MAPYTNVLASQQARLSEHTVRVLTGLVEALEKDPMPGKVEALRQEIAALRAQLVQLGAEMRPENESEWCAMGACADV